MRLKASHIALLVNVGVPASSFIVTRRLYKITRLQAAMISRQQESGFTTSLLLLNLICFYQHGTSYLYWNTRWSCNSLCVYFLI